MTANLLPSLIQAVATAIKQQADELTKLDQAIGDGDHVDNLQRGIQAVLAQADSLSQLEWPDALQKIGMTTMSTIGGASGSLYGTLFIGLAKNLQNKELNIENFANALTAAVAAVKQRGKADVGEKTMLDVWVPVANHLQNNSKQADVLVQAKTIAIAGAEATRDMLATKGRASFLGERSRGHVDAGAKSSEVMICAVVDELLKNQS